MKKLFFLAFLFCAHVAYSQDYVDAMASKSCSCLTTEQIKSSSVEEIQARLAGCMITEAMPYKKELKANHNINLDKLDRQEGEKLGKLVATRMITVCPEVLMKLGQMKSSPKSNILSKEGFIQTITENEFITITLKGDDNLTTKLLWLTNFAGADELAKAKDPKLTKVEVQFEVQELYDPRIKEYRNFNVIKGIKFLK
jgi:hypothetical protein